MPGLELMLEVFSESVGFGRAAAMVRWALRGFDRPARGDQFPAVLDEQALGLGQRQIARLGGRRGGNKE